jgi:antitoxin (DNA-binding transcriptional repressor) of toxin-antitoxin stability system
MQAEHSQALQAKCLELTPERLKQVPGLADAVDRLAAAQAEERRAQLDLDQAEAGVRHILTRQGELNAKAAALSREALATRAAALDGLIEGHESSGTMAKLTEVEGTLQFVMAALDVLGTRRIQEAQARVRAAQANLWEAEAGVKRGNAEVRRVIMAHYAAPMAALEGGTFAFESPAIQTLQREEASLLYRAQTLRAELQRIERT